MNILLSRSGLAPSVALVPLLLTVPLAAGAQSGNAQRFQLDDIRVLDPDKQDSALDEGTDGSLNEFFSLARCRCETPITVRFDITGLTSGESQSFAVVVGQNCIDNGNLDETNCVVRYKEQSSEVARSDAFDRLLDANELMSNLDCEEDSSNTTTLGLYVEESGVWQLLGEGLDYRVDVTAPTAPQKESDPQGGEGQAVVSFAKTDNEEGTRFQLLCVRLSGDGSTIEGPWKETHSYGAAFETAELLCGSGTTSAVDGGSGAEDASAGLDAGVDAGAGDAATLVDSGTDAAADGSTSGQSDNASGDLSPPDDLLDSARYVCSSALTGAGDTTIKGLEEGQVYGFYAVAIDKVGNPSEPTFLGRATPQPTEDLWERYRTLGGQGEGGYGCAMNLAGRSGAALLLGLVVMALILGRRSISRRSRRGRRA